MTAVPFGTGKIAFDCRRQLPLITLQRKDILAFLLLDLRGYLFLTPHGVDGDKHAFKLQAVQNLGNRGNLIRLVVHLPLRQYQTAFMRVGAQNMGKRPTIPTLTASGKKVRRPCSGGGGKPGVERRRRLSVGIAPLVGEEFVELRHGHAREAGKYVPQVSPWVKPMAFGGDDNAVQGSRSMAAVV